MTSPLSGRFIKPQRRRGQSAVVDYGYRSFHFPVSETE